MLAEAWARVKAYGEKPSETFHVSTPFAAYALDSAVARWGMAFDAAMAEAASDARSPEAAERKQMQVLRRWIPSQRRYADPNRR